MLDNLKKEYDISTIHFPICEMYLNILRFCQNAIIVMTVIIIFFTVMSIIKDKKIIKQIIRDNNDNNIDKKANYDYEYEMRLNDLSECENSIKNKKKLIKLISFVLVFILFILQILKFYVRKL